MLDVYFQVINVRAYVLNLLLVNISYWHQVFMLIAKVMDLHIFAIFINIIEGEFVLI